MKNTLLFTLVLTVFLSSCSKEGPAGAQGAQGPQGPTGPQGPSGSANVIYSPWFLTGTGWDTTGAAAYEAVALFNKPAAGITQSIMDNGIVLAYMKGDPTTGLTNDVFPLPYSIGVGYGFTDQWDFALNAPGNIRFIYRSDYPWTTGELGTISFRFMIIAGNNPGGRQMDPRKMSYEEVCKAYGIPE